MNNPQEERLNAYNDNVEAYISNTISSPSRELQYWIGESLEGISKDANIFEVGTGTGRDADYIESLGYKITRSDAADSFITYNKSKGKPMEKYNALTDKLNGKYDLIFADAVLLHFTYAQCERILTDRKNHLTNNGKVSRCVQLGEGEQTKENKGMKRHFYYWKEQEVKELMHIIGYNNIHTRIDEPEPNRLRIRCIATL